MHMHTNTHSVGWLLVFSLLMSLDPDLRCLNITSTITISTSTAMAATTQPAAATATILTTIPALTVCVCVWGGGGGLKLTTSIWQKQHFRYDAKNNMHGYR